MQEGGINPPQHERMVSSHPAAYGKHEREGHSQRETSTHPPVHHRPFHFLLSSGCYLQGAFAEHSAALARLGADVREVRLPEEFEGLDGIVLPGNYYNTKRRKCRRCSFLITKVTDGMGRPSFSWRR